MLQNFENLNQADVNRMSEDEYKEYEQSAIEKGFIYYYSGQQKGPEAANQRFFGTKKARLMLGYSQKWSLSPVLVWPEWDLKPLLMNENNFRSVMTLQHGIPKSILDDLIDEKFSSDFYEL